MSRNGEMSDPSLSLLQRSGTPIPEMSQADQKRLDILLNGNPKECNQDNSKLYVDPCIMSRLDEIDEQLVKLRRMRNQETDAKNSKTREYFKNKLLEIDETLKQITEIDKEMSELTEDDLKLPLKQLKFQ